MKYLFSGAFQDSSSHELYKNRIRDHHPFVGQAKEPVFLLHKLSFKPIRNSRKVCRRAPAKPGAERIGRYTLRHAETEKHELAGGFSPVDLFPVNDGLAGFIEERHVSARIFLITPSSSADAVDVRTFVAVRARAEA